MSPTIGFGTLPGEGPVRGPGLRRSLALTEVLVVIGIIAVLIALGIPGVQRVRSVASRALCADHLRQIGVALHSYHGTYDAFPAGLSFQGDASAYPYLGWQGRLLPFIEQDSLWERTTNAFRHGERFDQNPPHVGLSTVIALYSCPDDVRTRDPQESGEGISVALTSYVGVAGKDLTSNDGILFADSAVRLSDVTDGASQTLMVGERPPSADLNFGWWYGGVGQDGRGSCDMLLGVNERNIRLELLAVCPGGPFHFSPGAVTNQCDMFHFWSPHSGGANFLLVDGSARFLSYSAAAPLMAALASRAGGEAVEVP
jgi:prepilin-type processing-associated H-X9-DG protein